MTLNSDLNMTMEAASSSESLRQAVSGILNSYACSVHVSQNNLDLTCDVMESDIFRAPNDQRTREFCVIERMVLQHELEYILLFCLFAWPDCLRRDTKELV